MGDLIALNASSSDITLIGCLVLLLNIFLFVFFVYIFPFFVYYLSGTKFHGIAKVTVLFIFSLIATFCFAFFAAYTISFDYILSAISASFIIYTITGLALITGYSISEHRYPMEHKLIPYIITSVAAAAYMIYYFGFQLKNPCNLHSYAIVDSTGVENIFHSLYNSVGFFPDYYGNASLGLSYIGYFLEIFVIGAILFFVIAVLIDKIR